MTTRIYQARGDGRRLQCRLVGLRCATPDPDGVDIGGAIAPKSQYVLSGELALGGQR
jgi:hypothetical protein